ncbi:MAG TPA: heavy metal-associated domain-containing protein, partial [Thermoanaerobaculia bacterium]|nr:heavy metal-associated domain-containing protein [Thermoanaerobaculia bacterium]
VTLAIEGMHCASCVSTIEHTLEGVTGVAEASVNLATGQAQITGRGLNPRRLIEAVRTAGYQARPAGEGGGEGALAGGPPFGRVPGIPRGPPSRYFFGSSSKASAHPIAQK